MSFRIDFIPNRGRAPQVLLRQSWREGKRIRHKTIANLSNVTAHVDGFRAVLMGGTVSTSINDAVAIRGSLPHGPVAATLGMARTPTCLISSIANSPPTPPTAASARCLDLGR